MSKTSQLLNGKTEKYISELEDQNLQYQQTIHELKVALSVANEDLNIAKIRLAALEAKDITAHKLIYVDDSTEALGSTEDKDD